ncbi:hypothetical protein LTR86_011068, partial [Recurvomyces mirabilis]
RDSKHSLATVANRYIYASKVRHHFQRVIGAKQHEQSQQRFNDSSEASPTTTKLWLGLAFKEANNGVVEIGFVCHDGTYTTDFAVHELYTRAGEHSEDETGNAAEELIITAIRDYESKHAVKFVGAGISPSLAERSLGLTAQLWAEMDILPFVPTQGHLDRQASDNIVMLKDVDSMADSMARKCTTFFGPTGVPTIHFGHLNDVQVDAAGWTPSATLEQYMQTVDDRSARAALSYAHDLRLKKTQIAFFTARANGSEVAGMRHALLRFLHLAGVGSVWCTPTPKPEVIRILEANERTLNGNAKPDQHFTLEQQQKVTDWVVSNAERLWTAEGAPLAPRSRGGANVIVVDDPHMAVLVAIAKRLDSHRPVIYRTHIIVHPNQVADPESPAAQVWDWVWSHAKLADVFISNPSSSVESDTLAQVVPKHMLGCMVPTLDGLDGVNKKLSDRDVRYYLQEFNEVCRRQCMPTLAYPGRDYIVQVTSSDDYSDGAADALAAYAAFRRESRFCARKTVEQPPQLVLCSCFSAASYGGDETTGLDRAMMVLQDEYPDIKNSVILVRLPPSDQMINTLLSCARVVLQLSTQHVADYSLTIPQALLKGVPVIARSTAGAGEGGFPPLLIRHSLNGFLLQGLDKPADTRAVADYIDTLFVNEEKYGAMSGFAKAHAIAEISTVGNAMAWMFLADRLTSCHGLCLDGRWVWDLAREHAVHDGAGRAVLSLLNRYKLYNANYWNGTSNVSRKLEQEQKDTKDKRLNMIVLASWTCLQLESDILAELPIPSSAIHNVEDILLLPHKVPADETYNGLDLCAGGNDVAVFYLLHVHLRRKLNEAHRQLSRSDRLDASVAQVAETLRSHDCLVTLWRNSLPGALIWNNAAAPVEDVLSARLRGKYWEARYVMNRPFLDYALHISPFTKEGKAVREVACGVNSNRRDEAEICVFEAIASMPEDSIWKAYKRCIDTAMQSTMAFDCVPDRSTVSNIHGTAHVADGSDDDDAMLSKPSLVRKKSDELFKPALRPSSRRRYSSMPGTPTYSKSVHFTDNDNQTRHFLMIDKPVALSAVTSPIECYKSKAKYPFEGKAELEITLANFPVESFERRNKPVRVERISLSSDKQTLFGKVAVQNISFDKLVVARFTLDCWKIISEVVAEFSSDPRIPCDGCDRFTFHIELPNATDIENADRVLLLL